MNTPDFDQIIKRMKNDSLFSFLYPACKVNGVDTDQAIHHVKEMAKTFNQTEMDAACLYREILVKSSQI